MKGIIKALTSPNDIFCHYLPRLRLRSDNHQFIEITCKAKSHFQSDFSVFALSNFDIWPLSVSEIHNELTA